MTDFETSPQQTEAQIHKAEYLEKLRQDFAPARALVLFYPGGDARKYTDEFIRKGYQLAFCADALAGNIYIGSDHRSLFEENKIPDKGYLAGIYRYDSEAKSVAVETLIDWRPGHQDEVTDESTKKLIANKIAEFVGSNS